MLCRYERTIFKSDKGFCIFSYSTEDQSVPKEARNRSFYHDDKIHFTAIGYHLVASNAVEVELDGTWENSKHGLQLSVSMCKEIVPTNQAGILAYLSRVKTPEEEWIINKGMHEPIVSKELFDKVQDILSARQSEQGLATIYDSKSKRRSMFKGILRCGECGRSMYLRSKSNRGYYYYCTLHENYNATICPKKAVKQEDVESLALRLIQTQIRAFSDAQGLIANLNATPSSQTRYQIYETQIDDAKRNIEKFNQLKATLYGDFADGLLSHQDYTDLSEDYSRRADDLRIFIAELEKEKEKYSAGFGSKMQWALLVEKYKDQESIDAEMAAAFIETLTLFNDGHVEVAFRHRDEIEQVLYVAATRGKEAERYAG